MTPREVLLRRPVPRGIIRWLIFLSKTHKLWQWRNGMTHNSKTEIREDTAPYWFSPSPFRVSESFEEFVELNRELRVEQNANGEIVIMSPTGAESSHRNSSISAQLWIWSAKFGGKTFDSSVLFTLPNGSRRGPDASWISSNRWDAIPKPDRAGFAPICPDFVIELRSQSDRLPDLQLKMDEYILNGIKLGWLIDPFERVVHIYVPNQPTRILVDPLLVTGEPVLPGFILELKGIWSE